MAYTLVKLLVIALAICHNTVQPVAQAAGSTAGATRLVIPSAAKQFLEAHNRARAAAGVGPLKWSEQLAIAADLIARNPSTSNPWDCPIILNPMDGARIQTISGRGVIINMFRGSGITPRIEVNRWVEEKHHYNYANDSCAPSHDCGVYRQLVWKHTYELVCAQALCMMNAATFNLCFYNPPGNLLGQRP